MNIDELKTLFSLYQYELKEYNENQYAVFSLLSSTYPAVEIVDLGLSPKQLANIKADYGNSGYAVKVCPAKTTDELESYLFNLFFQVKETNSRINTRYEEYTQSILQSYIFQGANKVNKYEYVEVPYQVERNFLNTITSSSGLVNSIVNDTSLNGAHLIIVEAGAGFGMTSTAYEVLRYFSGRERDIRPFFMELAKDRSAATFRYLLLSQIDRSFNIKLGSDLVIYNIKKGRIPLIIDGFDELLSRDIDTGEEETNKNRVETMLSTIAELLTDQAKIVLTTRKTAIFAGENFYEWYLKYSNDGTKFQVIRYQLGNPSIESWLSPTKRKHLPHNMASIINPVILGYMRYLDEKEYLHAISNETLTQNYFEKLLRREKERQELPFSIEEQRIILRRLAAFFAGFNTTAQKRSEIKEAILELSADVLAKNETAQKDRVRLANTLSNHAFLDRKGESDIGFLNDFVFGTFLMYAIKDENDHFYDDYYKEITYSMMEKSLMAASVFDATTRQEFWRGIKDKCQINEILAFWSDIILMDTPQRNFSNISLDAKTLMERMLGTQNGQIANCSFSNIIFKSCIFDFQYITDCSFINCTFENCEKIGSNLDCGFYGCNDSKGDFVDYYEDETIEQKPEEDTNVLLDILALYFQVDKRSRRMRMISKIRDHFDHRTFKKAFSQLTCLGFIYTNGDKSHITQEGIDYYKKNRPE